LPGVVISNLTKTFGETVAVKDLSLEIKDKDFVVILGPSGCGKTTLLRCLAGLEIPDSGDIYIDDKVVNDLTPADRDISMVFQSYALYPHMTVFNNIAFPLKMKKIPKEEIKKRVIEAAKLLKIEHLLDRKPKQLSGGEKQRTALGRAIVRNPKVFLMDEPLSNLDAKLRVHMRVELKRLQKDLGVTTVYVTHDQVEAMTMADEVAIMNEGILHQLGDSIEIFENPTSLFVASFIGSPPMNIMDCSLTEKDGRAYIETKGFSFTISDETRDLIKEHTMDTELIFGIRPRDISISKIQTPDSIIKTTVYLTEPLGSEKIVIFQTEDDLIKVREKADFVATIGDIFWMSINKERMHIFDKKTETTII